jgi:hypothetical protein
MTINNDVEASAAYENLARMYGLCDRIAADATGYPETRKDEVESVRAMIRKIERQIAGLPYTEVRERSHTGKGRTRRDRRLTSLLWGVRNVNALCANAPQVATHGESERRLTHGC